MLASSEPAALDLPFVTRTESGICFWAPPERPTNYAAANALGRDYAEELLRFIRIHQNPLIFGSVVRAITEGTVYGPVEIGFCHRIGLELGGMLRLPGDRPRMG